MSCPGPTRLVSLTSCDSTAMREADEEEERDVVWSVIDDGGDAVARDAAIMADMYSRSTTILESSSSWAG